MCDVCVCAHLFKCRKIPCWRVACFLPEVFYVLLTCCIAEFILLYCLLKESIISCIGAVDRSRYLLGDHRGRLLMLFLEFQDSAELALGTVKDMKLEVLGEVGVLLWTFIILRY